MRFSTELWHTLAFYILLLAGASLPQRTSGRNTSADEQEGLNQLQRDLLDAEEGAVASEFSCGDAEVSGGQNPPSMGSTIPPAGDLTVNKKIRMLHRSPESMQVSLRYLVGSSALLPRPGEQGPDPAASRPEDISNDLFGLFTIQNNTSRAMNGWQLVWSFGSPADTELSRFRGGLPLAVQGTKDVRVVNTVRAH